MKYLTIITLLALAGCTKTALCPVAKTAGGLIAAHAAVQLDCKNVDAIRATIDEKLVDLKLCAQEAALTKGAIADVICGPIVTGLMSTALAQVPKEWECSGGVVGEDLKAKLIKACARAF